MKTDPVWKLVKRKKVFGSRFVNVYEDEIILPNGKTIDDYTVVEKPDYVLIVATDADSRLIVLDEYKHGAGKILACLPAGHLEKSESPVVGAERELREETGYGDGTFEEMGSLHDYTSKDIHKVFVVRARGVRPITTPSHEETETISSRLVSMDDLRKEVEQKKWQSSSSLAAIALAGLLSK